MGGKTNKNLERREELIEEVRKLVVKGITSPTLIMEMVPEIKSWQTANKYVKIAKRRLRQETREMDLRDEYRMFVVNLLYLRSKLYKLLEENKNTNQIIGLVKQINKIDRQLIELLELHSISLNSIFKNRKQYRDEKLQDDIIFGPLL